MSITSRSHVPTVRNARSLSSHSTRILRVGSAVFRVGSASGLRQPRLQPAATSSHFVTRRLDFERIFLQFEGHFPTIRRIDDVTAIAVSNGTNSQPQYSHIRGK